MTPVKLTLYQC